MTNSVEIWDVYDKNRVKTGKTRVRGERLAEGEYILIAMVLIFNSRGQMLMQQRQGHLKWASGMWTMTAGGAVKAGETSAAAAARELFEELGIKMCFDMRPCFSMTNNTAFMDYFLVVADVDIAEIGMPTDEVAAVKWAAKDEMQAMIVAGECIPYRAGFLEFCFEMGRKYGLTKWDADNVV